MDRPDRKNRKEKKSPRTPIKTYRWEDIRRARKKGGYPWTHLYKQPFNEELHPEWYTMEGLRKTNSTSTMGGKSFLTISEITEFDREESVTPDVEKIDCTLQIIDEPDDHSMKTSAANSVIIEECEVNEKENKKPDFLMDSAESSDDISQYLDKDERGPNKTENGETAPESIEKPEEMQVDEEKKKDDDTSKRKRKLSAESSYSRISQTKSAILKKIKDTKNKIKVPKISFPTRKSMVKKQKTSPPETKKEVKKTNGKNVKPVYLHIPLKPPPGETDEFSHLEFEDKSDTTVTKPAVKPGSFKDLVKSLKQLKETESGTKTIKEESKDDKIESNEKGEAIKEVATETKEKTDHDIAKINIKNENAESPKIEESSIIIKDTDNGNAEVDKVEIVEITDKTDINSDDEEQKSVADQMDELEKLDIIFPKMKTKHKKNLSPDSLLDPNNQIIEVVEETNDPEKDDHNDKPEETNQEDIFERLFQVTTTSKTDEESATPEVTQPRSKSVEPEKRRKLSMESSYSRKSLSKLGILKKLKEATDKIKSTFTRSDSKKQKKLKEEQLKKEANEAKKEAKKEADKVKSLKSGKKGQPVYIHIPLKPSEGQIDDFSSIENEEKISKDEAKSSEDELASTPDSTLQGNDVQLIILTAPSDDEILDYTSSDVAETPSSETKTFFNDKNVDELKVIAKGAVDVVEHPKHKHTLEPVTEESGSDRMSVEESSIGKDPEVTKTHVDEVPEINEKVVDIEDGLSETKLVEKKEELQRDKPDDDNDETDKTLEIKSSLKGEGSPLKKKVSFKRRSKTPKDGSYEDIQAPPSETTAVLAPDQSTQDADKEKAELDEKVDTNTSVEEHPNEWSTINDHEYEPVNPPPDNITITPPPASPIMPSVYIEDIDPDDSILPLGTVPFDKLIHSPPAKIVGETLKQEVQPYRDDRGRTPPIVTFSPAEDITPPTPPVEEKPKSGPNKFQIAFKQKTDNIKNKLHNIKKPNIHLPNRPKFNKPNFSKLKIQKPKINLPKIPDKTKINLPSFSLPRRHTAKRPLKERKLSTESNASDSKKPLFNFSTYPRFFKRKPKVQDESKNDIPDFATVPRSSTKTDSSTAQTASGWSGSDSMRIPLHSEDSLKDVEYREDAREMPKDAYDDDLNENTEPSHIRYEQDIDIDDEFERQNNDIDRGRDFLNRWDRGRFNREERDDYIENYRNSQKVTDLDSPEDVHNKGYDFNANTRDNYSSGSSHGAQRSGVLEEINSDEFLWRQKGISQEDMDIRMYLSSEIKEAFKTPKNALAQMDGLHDRNYNLRGSNQSLPEASSKKRSIKKPKRKKTPQTSQEQIPYAGDSGDEDDEESSPPSRPRRRSGRSKKTKKPDEVIPYQETISSPEKPFRHRESMGGILGDDERDEESIMYENEKMEGKEQPDIQVIDPYKHMEFADEDIIESIPAVPQRKNRSLKSLASENDSILDDLGAAWEPEIIKTDSKLIIPIQSEAPRRPTRTISRTSSESQKDAESLSRRTESYSSEQQIPCVEEPCFQDIRDSMGYAIVDKSRVRDPPLPPPRAPRRKRSLKAKEDKFFTVPRSRNENTPTRPLRNYSTLGQVRNAMESNTYENKENIDITGYVEIEDEPSKDLLKGDVIKKMKDRPLPAPPRPPRKSRLESRLLQDITSRENIPEPEEDFDKPSGETETATQTEPLPDDFVCEEVVQEPTDIIITPSKSIEKQPAIERRLITPNVYHYEETITHGSLLVEPINGAKLLPDYEITQVPKEKIVPVSRESDVDETSSIPEEFSKLQDGRQDTNEVDIMQTQKLKVTDLDVDTLSVNKLMADKIIVSEIDSSKINTDEISSNSGALKVGEITLPPGVIEGIIKTLQSTSQISTEEPIKKTPPLEDDFDEQKKTSISEDMIDKHFTSEINVELSSDYIKEKTPVLPPAPTLSNNNEACPISPPESPLDDINKENPIDPSRFIDNVNEEFPLPRPDLSDDNIKEEPPIPPPRATNLECTNLEMENLDHTSHLTNSPEQENPESTPSKSSDLEYSEEKIPPRPPRQYEKNQSAINQENRIQEPEIDDEPPPRPPQPQLDYIPSQPPPSFYALRAQKFVDSFGENIPVVPRRRRHTKSRPKTRSSSDDSSGASPASRRLHRRSSEPSIAQLSGQLATACGLGVNNALRRLITYIMRNVLGNEDGKQDLNVMIMIVLVLIAGLILLGYGDEKTVVHLHHWEYFNPPRDL